MSTTSRIRMSYVNAAVRYQWTSCTELVHNYVSL